MPGYPNAVIQFRDDMGRLWQFDQNEWIDEILPRENMKGFDIVRRKAKDACEMGRYVIVNIKGGQPTASSWEVVRVASRT